MTLIQAITGVFSNPALQAAAWGMLLWPSRTCRVVLGMLAYGAGIELAQWAVGWRFAELADLAADAVGVLVAWMVASGWKGFDSMRRLKSHTRLG